jgi:hypothetical protein
VTAHTFFNVQVHLKDLGTYKLTDTKVTATGTYFERAKLTNASGTDGKNIL